MKLTKVQFKKAVRRQARAALGYCEIHAHNMPMLPMAYGDGEQRTVDKAALALARALLKAAIRAA